MGNSEKEDSSDLLPGVDEDWRTDCWAVFVAGLKRISIRWSSAADMKADRLFQKSFACAGVHYHDHPDPMFLATVTDLGRLDSMGVDCAAEVARMMELCDRKGVDLIVRVIPDPMKDIGLGILSHFHYSYRPRTITCKSMVEAAKLLSV